MKIVILDGYTENPGDLTWESFEALGEVSCYERTDAKQVAERIKGAEIVITNKTAITAEMMDADPQLRYIGVLATGYDVVDVSAAQERGIALSNVPDYGTKTVAQYAIALLLEVCSRVGHHSQAVKQGRWSAQPDWCFWDYPLIELAGKTMGIIGFGRIGQATAAIARALGMQVIYSDPILAKQKEYRRVEQEELLRVSDVVVLHCPLTPENHALINEHTLTLMKPSAILINNARGALIDEAALAQALRQKTIYAAALDVAGQEPIAADHPLLSLDNCILTPHISWASHEARARIMQIAADNVAAFLKGQKSNRIV